MIYAIQPFISRCVADICKHQINVLNLIISQALKRCSVLYCICRKPYDKERAMIACDRCSEWYHFDCVNLPEPDSGDEGCELLLEKEYGPTGEFICPACKPSETQERSSFHVKVDNEDR